MQLVGDGKFGFIKRSLIYLFLFFLIILIILFFFLVILFFLVLSVLSSVIFLVIGTIVHRKLGNVGMYCCHVLLEGFIMRDTILVRRLKIFSTPRTLRPAC